MVKYRIDTENVVFGERQHVIKICIVDKKTGTVEVRDECLGEICGDSR